MRTADRNNGTDHKPTPYWIRPQTEPSGMKKRYEHHGNRRIGAAFYTPGALTYERLTVGPGSIAGTACDLWHRPDGGGAVGEAER